MSARDSAVNRDAAIAVDDALSRAEIECAAGDRGAPRSRGQNAAAGDRQAKIVQSLCVGADDEERIDSNGCR